VSVKDRTRQDIPYYLEKLLIENAPLERRTDSRCVQDLLQTGALACTNSPLGQILEAVGETIEPLPRHTPSASAQAEDCDIC